MATGIQGLPTYIYIDNKEVLQFDDGMLMLPKGAGVIWGDGNRYRVADTWFSIDHHGQMNDGMHIFLEVVMDPEDDLPKKILPSYFVD